MPMPELLDEELRPFIDIFPHASLYAGPTLEDARAAIEALVTAGGSEPDGLAVDSSVHKVKVSDETEIDVVIHTPTAVSGDPRPVLFHCHGGGFVAGSAWLASAKYRDIAATLDCIVVSVDYRLAPEAKFPTQIEDCYAALQWLNRAADELNVDKRRIVLEGDSAGGGLAAALALLARERGGIRISHLHLLYPMLDDRTCVTEPHPFAGEHIWNWDANIFGWTSLLGQPPGSEGVSQFAAAARAQDLSGLPSTFLMIGALDLFIDENLEFAKRLIRAGVPTELHVYPGGFHGFDAVPGAQIAETARRDSMAALARALQKR